MLNKVVKGEPEFAVVVITEVQRVESLFGKLIPSSVIVAPAPLKFTRVELYNLLWTEFQDCQYRIKSRTCLLVIVRTLAEAAGSLRMPKSERNKRIDGWMDRMGRSLMSIAGRFLFLLDPCKSVCLTLVYVARLSNFLLPSILDYLPKGFSRAPNELSYQILLIWEK